MKKIGVLFLLIVCLISGCSCENEEVNKTTIYASLVIGYDSIDFEKEIPVQPFGTKMSLNGYYKDKIDNVKEEFNSLVNKYHSLLDRNYYYKDENDNLINNIKVINDNYGSGQSVIVDKIVIEALKEGIKYTKLSKGKFNIFSGSIVDVWDERFDISGLNYAKDPSEEEVTQAMSCVVKVSDIDAVFVIDESNNSIVFNELDGCDGSVSITLGAMAKSFFLDEISKLDSFKQLGPCLYDGGTSSIIVKGDNPIRENGEWYITVRDALNSNVFFGKEAALMVLDGDNAISTSGVDQKGYVNKDGVRRHHIINALTGYPEDYLLSVTVVGESALIMDIVTTTIMTMSDIEEIKEYLLNLKTNDIDVGVLLQQQVKVVSGDKSYEINDGAFTLNDVVYTIKDNSLYNGDIKVVDINNERFVIYGNEYKVIDTVKLMFNEEMGKVLDEVYDDEMIVEEIKYGA